MKKEVNEIYYAKVLQNVRQKALACGRQPNEITLIAVSKTHSVASIQKAYQQGGRAFGESRVMEALEKISHLPKDCQWHLIGSLQSNKVGKAVSSFHLIHTVDTPQLAQKISQMSDAKGVTTSILLQVNTSNEITKRGLSADEWEASLDVVNPLSNIRIEGLMTMAPFTTDEQVIRPCFRELFQLREKWRSRMKEPAIFQQLSMGMSNDYLIAIEEGATLLRVGSAIFDSRLV